MTKGGAMKVTLEFDGQDREDYYNALESKYVFRALRAYTEELKGMIREAEHLEAKNAYATAAYSLTQYLDKWKIRL